MKERGDETSQGHAASNALDILVRELKSTLEYSRVLTPDSEGYSDSIKRWSDSVEKRAVRAIYIDRKNFKVDRC